MVVSLGIGEFLQNIGEEAMTMVVWRKCPICGQYYTGEIASGKCKCGFDMFASFLRRLFS